MKKIASAARLLHLFRRAGFGAGPALLDRYTGQPLGAVVEELISEPAAPLSLVTDEPPRTLPDSLPASQRPQQAQQMLEENREHIGELNAAWLGRMGHEAGVFREKMTLFWHGHFACRSLNARLVQRQNNTLRQHALGSFGELLRAVAHDPAMLQFLNNQQNRRQSPNENFARELMELFTLGRGHYTEADVKAAARAFTGWGFSPGGQFVLRQHLHDTGEKTFFGETKNFDGDAILDRLLGREQTAVFIAGKLYRFFVNDMPDEKIVASLGRKLFRSSFNIKEFMQDMLTADMFYEPRQVGVKIKSPIELLAGYQRTLGLHFGRRQAVLYVQKALDQVLFYPPSVAGWPGGTTWIDASSLLFRMSLPDLVFRQKKPDFQPKDEGDVNTEYLSRRSARLFSEVRMDWPGWEAHFPQKNKNERLDALAAVLLPHPLTPAQRLVVLGRLPEASVRELTLALMALPEFQLC